MSEETTRGFVARVRAKSDAVAELSYAERAYLAVADRLAREAE